MGKAKQRPRLSKGFAEAQKAKKTTKQASNDLSVLAGLGSGITLNKVQAGKITKGGRKATKLKSLARKHGTEQLLEATRNTTSKSITGELFSSPQTAGETPSPILTMKQIKFQIRKKKERKSMKKEVFQKKIELIKKTEKQKQEKKARERTVIVKDMKPLLDALPTLSSFSESTTMVKKRTAPIPSKTKFKMKKRNEEIAQGLAYFSQAMKK